ESLVLWAADLRSGRAIPSMPIAFLVGLQLITKYTDGSGLVVWPSRTRPSFALAEAGAGRAFVSLLPQAPLPATLVAMRLDSAVVRAGGRVRFAGFVRRRTPGGYRPAPGDVKITLAARGRTFGATTAHLDAAGAFSGELTAPSELGAGEYALLAVAGGGVGGTSVHVDSASDVRLSVRANCPCDPDTPLPLQIVAQRGADPAAGLAVHVRVVRTPHIVPPGAPEDTPRWGTTLVADNALHTDAQGRAVVTIPQPTDGLDSTYGVAVTTPGASATARVTLPQARVALALEPDAANVEPGVPVALNVRAFDPVDGTPAPGLSVNVRLSHGATVQDQTLKLDERGRGRAIFNAASLGSNLALAAAAVDGKRALDATAVNVEPGILAGAQTGSGADAAVDLERERYRPGDSVGVRASANGATGEALLTLEGARTYQMRVTAVKSGVATATLPLGEAQGDVRAAAAFVRDGAIALASAPIAIDGPGRPRALSVGFDKPAYAPGDTLRATLRDGSHAEATLALRVADGPESGPAFFDDAPAVLVTGGTTSQNSASDNPAWHVYVAPARSKASDIFAAERPTKVPTEVPSLGAAASRTLFWRVERGDGQSVDVPVPRERGRYVLSILELSDDGDVGAASAGFNVQ
ncbi:MAG TPA: hypothetical protein VKG44_03100, partial [Candidatus Baltobacteraceae bacterium]|nr:hypothetical protein [Candidatus Baltobacteraceae bacterium]